MSNWSNSLAQDVHLTKDDIRVDGEPLPFLVEGAVTVAPAEHDDEGHQIVWVGIKVAQDGKVRVDHTPRIDMDVLADGAITYRTVSPSMLRAQHDALVARVLPEGSA